MSTKSIDETVEQIQASGLLAEVNELGDLAVATRSGAFLGHFPAATPVRAVIAAAAAYAKGLKDGRDLGRKSK